MCEPTTLLIAATAAQAGGQLISGMQQASEYSRQAGIANQNAALAEEQGDAAEAQRRGDLRRMMAESRVNAAVGAGLGGSANDVLGDMAAQSELDARNLRYGYSIDAMNYRNQATSLKSKARSSRMNAFISAGTTALTGAYEYSTLPKKPKPPTPFGTTSGGSVNLLNPSVYKK